MPKPPSPRPLSIKVISIISLSFGGLLFLGAALELFSPTQTVLNIPESHLIRLGFRIPTQVVLLLNFLHSVLLLYLGIALWRLQELARKLSIGCAGLSMLNSVLNSIYRLTTAPTDSAGEPTMVFVHVLGLGMDALINGSIICFLLKRKAAFQRPKA